MKYRLIPEWPNLLLGTIFGADVPKNTESEIFFCGEIEDIAKLRVPFRSFTPLMIIRKWYFQHPQYLIWQSKGLLCFGLFSSFHAMSTFSSIEYLNNHWVRESLSTDAIFSSDIDLHLIVVFLSPSSEINTTKRIGWCRSPALKLYVNISSTPHSKLSSHSQILWHNVHVRLLHSGACWCCKCVPYFCENHVHCQSKF